MQPRRLYGSSQTYIQPPRMKGYSRQPMEPTFIPLNRTVEYDKEKEPVIPIYANSKCLHVSGLHQNVTECLLKRIFSIVGHVVSCKIMRDKNGDSLGYGFVEFVDHESARFAKDNMDERIVYGKELKVNWTYENDPSTQGQFKLFVGGLNKDITDDRLYHEFKQFGRITDSRVLRDTQTGKSKCYGFVTFVLKEDAEKALEMMSGEKIDGRSVKVNWVTNSNNNNNRNTSASSSAPVSNNFNQRLYDEVSKKSSSSNCTVFVANIPPSHANIEDTIKDIFRDFGSLQITQVNKDKRFGFVIFSSHDMATKAIMSMNDFKVSGCVLRCSWGRDLSRK